MPINHRETASGQPRRQTEETGAGRELPTSSLGRSGLPLNPSASVLPSGAPGMFASQPAVLAAWTSGEKGGYVLCHHAFLPLSTEASEKASKARGLESWFFAWLVV